ncbi:bifunctional folylpolyglutamate synthetase/dihydrofolate synthetase [Gammaproteobacteria bacterium]
MAGSRDLPAWLAWQSSLHPRAIVMGLERVRAVWARLSPPKAPPPVITVAGTNGKGSTVAFLEGFLASAGYRVGTYTSPHLSHYAERIRLEGRDVSEPLLCQAFERIEVARQGVPLTYFEFGTLAALDLFSRTALDVWVLEVGLGGRLDAVNLIDASVAVVTTIGFDHQDWLGHHLDQIAGEKAGICRPGRPLVIGQAEAPAALRPAAETLGATCWQAGREYEVSLLADGWDWRGPVGVHRHLPFPTLRGEHQIANAACALMALDRLTDCLPVDIAAIQRGLIETHPPGRCQVYPGNPTWILDVAHNPQAVAALAAVLQSLPCQGRTLAVFSCLADKDPQGMAEALEGMVDRWYLAPLEGPRSLSGEAIQAALRAGGITSIQCYADFSQALAKAHQEADSRDQILVFGSFLAVAAAMKHTDPA